MFGFVYSFHLWLSFLCRTRPFGWPLHVKSSVRAYYDVLGYDLIALGSIGKVTQYQKPRYPVLLYPDMVAFWVFLLSSLCGWAWST